MATIRRQRVAPPVSDEQAAIEERGKQIAEALAPDPGQARRLARRRVLPATSVTDVIGAPAAEEKPLTFAEQRERSKAYLPTAEETAALKSGKEYLAVIKRYEDRVKNPLTAIRARCIQCCCGQPKEVLLCPSVTCALHPFRMGTNPNNKRTKERLEREAAGEDTSGEDDGE